MMRRKRPDAFYKLSREEQTYIVVFRGIYAPLHRWLKSKKQGGSWEADCRRSPRYLWTENTAAAERI